MEQDLALLNGGSGKLSEFIQKPSLKSSNQILQVQTTAKFEDNNNKNNFDETREHRLHGEHIINNGGNMNNLNQQQINANESP